MNIYRSLTNLPPTPVVATIGNFDGVHRGHRWVIAQVNARARSLGLPSLAITFDPHPVRVLRPELPHSLITPLEQKLELLAQTGIDATLVLPFTEQLSHLTAEAFARDILRDAIHVREVHEGETFRFGYQASADMQSLEALGKALGFRAVAYSPLIFRRGPVSSSRIRALLSAGAVSQARALLGRPFAIRSTPASGRGYGTRYTVPTINLAPYPELLPAHGVYITTLTVAGECFQAVTNIGNRPTFGADSFTVESHLLNFHPIALAADTPLELAFLHRLRDELRFPGPEALLAQIKRDVAHAQRFFSLANTLPTDFVVLP
jgi:riboflavin kinase/FMN adenylyltransferase